MGSRLSLLLPLWEKRARPVACSPPRPVGLSLSSFPQISLFCFFPHRFILDSSLHLMLPSSYRLTVSVPPGIVSLATCSTFYLVPPGKWLYPHGSRFPIGPTTALRSSSCHDLSPVLPSGFSSGYICVVTAAPSELCPE